MASIQRRWRGWRCWSGKKLRLVARALVENAIDGDTTAARECFDRMDGKVTQGADTTDQVRGNVTFTWTPPAD